MRAKPRSGKSRPAQRPGGKRTRPTQRAKPTRQAKSTARPASGKRAGARPATRGASRGASATRGPRRRPASRRPPASRWLRFVEQHGVVLASARGPVPSVAEAVAGEPIVGSWWAHARGKAIFAALSELDDSDDVRCFRLIDGKVTFVHRRLWPALARLASAGVLAAERAAAVQQEHLPTGEHRNLITPFPDWVPDEVARAAQALTVDAARAELGPWL